MKADEEAFTDAMLDIYRQAYRIGYNAKRFLQMVGLHGGVTTAKQLLREGPAASGFAELLLRGRRDLTMEAMILREARWHLFLTPDELKVARARMSQEAF